MFLKAQIGLGLPRNRSKNTSQAIDALNDNYKSFQGALEALAGSHQIGVCNV